MIEKLIDQEVKKFKATTYEIQEKVLNDDTIIYLLPNQFILTTYFQVKSNDSLFKVSLQSDDKNVVYTEENSMPLVDPLNSRNYFTSDLYCIHRGFLQSITDNTSDSYFLYYYLINLYVN